MDLFKQIQTFQGRLPSGIIHQCLVEEYFCLPVLLQLKFCPTQHQQGIIVEWKEVHHTVEQFFCLGIFLSSVIYQTKPVHGDGITRGDIKDLFVLLHNSTPVSHS